MKIAVVYNRDRGNAINLFGTPNRETIGLKTISRLTTALKAGGYSVIALEGDKDLVNRLEEFVPRVVKGERPGLVFNVSYGIQGQARYTHVPSILEMVGIPYVASGPLAHSLCLDKVVTKMILRQHGLPTPDFRRAEHARRTNRRRDVPDDRETEERIGLLRSHGGPRRSGISRCGRGHLQRVPAGRRVPLMGRFLAPYGCGRRELSSLVAGAWSPCSMRPRSSVASGTGRDGQ